MPKIRIKFSFLLFNALIFIFRDSQLILGFYGACIVHELGHILAVYLTGEELISIEFSWTGIRMAASQPKTTKNGIIVQISGPFANLFCFLFLIAGGKAGYFTMFCLAEGVLNLLPYKCLDGGAILEMLADISPNEHRCRILNMMLRVLTTIIVVGILFSELNKQSLNLFIN